MATKDFRASQVRLSQIIGSGSDVGNKPSILIVSASDSSGFEGEALSNSSLLSKVGSDVFLFVTGSVNTRDAVTLFGGDVVISGTMYAERQVVEVDLSATGSLSVSGSLIVSQSATIYEGLVVNETGESGPENDLRVETSNKTHALFVDASQDQVLILTAAYGGTDVAFYVSGTVDNKDSTSNRGTSVFGGDAVVSGTFYTEKIQSRTNQGSTNDTYIDVGASTSDTLKFYAGSAEEVRINASGLHVADAISHIGDDDTTIQFGTDQIILQAGGKPGLRITESATNPDRIDIGGNNSLAQRFDQVLIMSGGDTSSPTEGSYTDTNFFVSGTIGSRDSASVRGAALFGGDLVVSGALVAKNGSVSGGSISGSIHHTAGGLSYLVAGSNISIVSGSNGQVTITSTGGGDGTVTSGSFNEVSITGEPNSFVTTASVSFAGEKGINYDVHDTGVDTFFFVSGTTGLPRGSTSGKVSVFGGDTVVSGVLDLKSNSIHSGSLFLGQNSTITNATTPNTQYAFGGSAGGAGLQLNLAATSRDSSEIKIQDKNAALTIGYISQSQANDRDGTAASTRHLVLKPGSTTAGIRLEGFGSGGGLTKSSLTAFSHSVLIMTGGLPAKALDTSFYVSGSIGSLGSTDRGSSVFGGDTKISGSLVVANGISGSLTHLTDGSSYLVAGSNITIATGSSGAVTITAAGGGSGEWTDGGDFIYPSDGNGESVVIGGNSVGDADIYLKSDGSAVFNEQAAAVDFRVESSNKVNALLVDGSTDQVLVLSGGNSTSTNEAAAGDVNFYVSGTVGSRGTSTRGTAVFGGDVVISGTLSGGSPLIVADGLQVTGTLDVSSAGALKSTAISGSLTHLVDGTSYLVAGANITIASGSSGNVTIASTGGGDVSISGTPANNQISIWTDASTIEGDAALTYDGVTINLDDAVTINESGGDKDFRVESQNKTHSLFVDANTNQVLILSGGGEASYDEASGADVNFYVSGTVGSKGGSVRGSAVFGGDVCVSGSLYPQILMTPKLSGSLTNLTDGTSYLVAGSNITITSGTNGSITIASSGGGDGTVTSGSFNVPSPSEFVTTASISVAGGKGMTYTADSNGVDTFFFVSGTIGSKDSSTAGTAVFGGDAVISGALYVSTPGVGQDVIFYGEDSSAIGLQWDADGGDHGKLTLGQDDHGVDFQVYGEDSNNYINWQQASNTLSLYAPQGEINTKGNVIFDVSSQGWDFTVNTNNKTGIFVDGSEDQVLILSGGGVTSYNEASGADVNFYVSGTIGGKGAATRGISVFGGDLCSSGSVYATAVNATTVASTALTGSLTKLHDGTSYLVAGSNVTIATGSSGAVTISASSGGSGEWTDGGDFIYPSDGGGESVVIGGNSVEDADIYLKSDGAAVFNEQGASVDFRVESDTKTHALFVDGSTDQVLILSGGNSTSVDESSKADVAFYVSGSRSGNDRGTALFGGDLVSSGTILPGADLGSNLGAPSRRFGNIYTGDLHLRNDRGDWTIVEEADYLCVVNNLTGKKFKMALIPLDEE